MLNLLARLSRMSSHELLWRTRAAACNGAGRVQMALRQPRWRRAHLRALLAHSPDLEPIRREIARGNDNDAHRLLASHFQTSPARFVVHPAERAAVAARITEHFPGVVEDAVQRARPVLDGDYDLLGYHGLRFGPDGGPDWHRDPVHDRRAPLAFWSSVPYLDESCGDHKIVWELNRHQHWIRLGRAYWLTGDRRYKEAVCRELSSWMAANPPLVGINWASMLELGLRSLSWIWAVNFFAHSDAAEEPPWLVDLLLALDRQLLQVERHLSYYFSPNTHLLGEGLALYVGGRCLPELAHSGRRAMTGRRILLDQIDRQVGGDGGHLERSTHYHRYTLDFYLMALVVARITHDEAEERLAQAVERLAQAARLLSDDRGCLPHFGDDDGGALMPMTGREGDDVSASLATAAALLNRPELAVGPPPEEAFWLLAQPDLAATVLEIRPQGGAALSAALPDTGYYVSRSPAGDHLVIDGGPHGFQNGGHAHADALSMTLTVQGRPLLVDPGTFCYTVNPTLRDRFRSTALHNTLTLDGRSQSLPAGPFHWRQTAVVTTRRWRTERGFDYFEGSHDGYLPCEHRRHVLAVHRDLIVVADLVTGAGTHTADVHWHVDPRWRASGGGKRLLISSGDERVELAVSGGEIELHYADEESGLGWQAPVYGRLEPALTVRIRGNGGAPYWIASVFGLDRFNEVVDVARTMVWAEAGVLRHSCGLRVTRARSTDYVLFADPYESSGATRSTRPRDCWRIADLDSQARVLFYRTGALERLICTVDGSDSHYPITQLPDYPIQDRVCAGLPASSSRPR
jgi:uncharacterized heparinase superfamily protein